MNWLTETRTSVLAERIRRLPLHQLRTAQALNGEVQLLYRITLITSLGAAAALMLLSSLNHGVLDIPKQTALYCICGPGLYFQQRYAAYQREQQAMQHGPAVPRAEDLLAAEYIVTNNRRSLLEAGAIQLALITTAYLILSTESYGIRLSKGLLLAFGNLCFLSGFRIHFALGVLLKLLRGHPRQTRAKQPVLRGLGRPA